MLLGEAHLALGGRTGDAGGFQAVLDYATLDAEIPFLSTVALSDWGFHGLLTVRGANAEKVLQNVLTNDLATLRVGQAQPSLLLTAKGKVAGAFRIWRHTDDHYDVLVEASCFAQAKADLERYTRVGKVELEDRGRELSLFLVQGPRGPDAVREALEGEAPKPREVVETATGNVLAHDALASAPGHLLLVRREQARDAWDRLLQSARQRGGGPVGWVACDAARVRAGVPRVGAEASAESLPGEAGLDAAISYKKGCFVGQEVVARIKNLGHVNRLAVRLQPDAACEAGDVLTADGKDVGKVTSVARGPGAPAALAVVRREIAEAGKELGLGAGQAKIVGLAQLA